jgi:hypothetical protein
MRSALILTVALSLALAASGAQAQKLDKNGRCHDKSGKFAKADVCKGGMLGPTTGPAHTYKLDGKGMCHDDKGKMAKKTFCK